MDPWQRRDRTPCWFSESLSSPLSRGSWCRGSECLAVSLCLRGSCSFGSEDEKEKNLHKITKTPLRIFQIDK